jgi:pimeloyl-ACP methyl ester carboxylesterase
VDLPGFGRSPLPKEVGNNNGSGEERDINDLNNKQGKLSAWGTEEYGELLFRYMSGCMQKDMSVWDILGHSFGGRIALRIAARHVEMIDSLILIGSHGLQMPLTFKRACRLNWIKTLRWGARFVDGVFRTNVYSEKFIPLFGSRDYLNAGELRSILVKTVNEDQTLSVQNIQARTLLLWGARDQETPPIMGRRFKELIRESQLIELANHGHHPFEDVGAHLCAYHIIKFWGLA